MKKFTVNVEESKVIFFLELMKSLSFVEVSEEKEYSLSSEQTDFLEERIADYQKNPSDVHDWEDVEKEMEEW